MAAGYAFGAVLRMEPDRRDKLCLRIGGAATVAFILLAFAVTAMDTSDEPGPPFILRMLNQQKYPASQLFLMMTIGPAILAIPWIERASGWFASMLETFGRVPMFYYLLHIPLIHAISLVVMRMRGATGMSQWYATAPGAQVPPEQRWSLLLLYGVFVVAVALLYVACRWYARLKSERRAAWMRYV
jgi:uncharacterized membrane protein